MKLKERKAIGYVIAVCPCCSSEFEVPVYEEDVDLESRLEKLEAVAEAARVVERAIRYQPLSQQGGCYLLAREDVEDLREALAALEETMGSSKQT